MNASLPHTRWVVTADGRQAALFRCRTTPALEFHLDHVRTLRNEHEADPEQHRPSQLGGAERKGDRNRSGARAAPHSASFDRETDEQRRRFAREMGEWLADATRELGAPYVSVVAAPRLFGLLREELPRHPNLHAELHEGELSHLGSAELASHPTVRGVLLSSPEAAQR